MEGEPLTAGIAELRQEETRQSRVCFDYELLRRRTTDNNSFHIFKNSNQHNLPQATVI